MRQSRVVGTARRAVRRCFWPERSPRRGDPTFPIPSVTDALRHGEDVAIHADGHITLQYRATAEGKTADETAAEHGSTRGQRRADRRGGLAPGGHHPEAHLLQLATPGVRNLLIPNKAIPASVKS